MKSKLTDEDIPDLADLMGELSCPVIFGWKKTLLPKPKPQLSLGLIAKGADNFWNSHNLRQNEDMSLKQSDWVGIGCLDDAVLCYSIRSKTKTNGDSLRLVFPRCAPTASFCWEFWLVRYITNGDSLRYVFPRFAPTTSTVFAGSFDWFTALPVCHLWLVRVITLVFGFTTQNWKPVH